jgi:hypothetical protein
MPFLFFLCIFIGIASLGANNSRAQQAPPGPTAAAPFVLNKENCEKICEAAKKTDLTNQEDINRNQACRIGEFCPPNPFYPPVAGGEKPFDAWIYTWGGRGGSWGGGGS